MGWTQYRAAHYRNGKIDRKAECDAYFMEGANAGYYRVEKSAMVGSVYYAAVTGLRRYANKDGKRLEEDIPAAEQVTFAVVFLTQTESKSYYNFYYKDMDETMGPYKFDCPKSILDLLSPTDNEHAQEWRRRCRDKIAAKKAAQRDENALENLPIGSVIEVKCADGSTKQFVKHSPAYQFKRAFWLNCDRLEYISKKHIPADYRVIKVG